jgi:hypothetical protein
MENMETHIQQIMCFANNPIMHVWLFILFFFCWTTSYLAPYCISSLPSLGEIHAGFHFLYWTYWMEFERVQIMWGAVNPIMHVVVYPLLTFLIFSQILSTLVFKLRCKSISQEAWSGAASAGPCSSTLVKKK